MVLLKLEFQQDLPSEDLIIVDSEEVMELPPAYQNGTRYNGEIVDIGENYSMIATIILSATNEYDETIYYTEISDDDYDLYQELQQRDLQMYIVFD